jgi:peptidoglycan hydrolase-like protein with peptidoglycan-binding domain
MKQLAIIAGILLAGAVVGAELPSAYAQTAATSSDSSVPSKTISAKKKKKHHSRHEPKQMAPTSDRIEEIQSALASNGYYQGTPNGKWDSTTVAAMQKFQGDHGLDANGKLDALSLQKLGLGSEIAGVSAPRTVKATPQNATPVATPPATAKPQAPKPPDAPASASPASTTPAAVTPTASSSKPAPPQPQ